MYSYDNNGNMTSRVRKDGTGSTLYAWDYRNRLTDVTFKDGSGNVTGSVHYAYGASNNRISKVVKDASGTVTLSEFYVYDGSNLLLVLDGSGNVKNRYLNGLGQNQVLAEDTNISGSGAGTTHWALADHEGSVRDVTGNSGTVLDHIVYDSFGKIVSQTNSSYAMRMGYTGQVQDAETGLNYDRARYYDPTTGRFLSTDPAGFSAGDANLYRYVGNSPVDKIDPTGLCADGTTDNGSLPEDGTYDIPATGDYPQEDPQESARRAQLMAERAAAAKKLLNIPSDVAVPARGDIAGEATARAQYNAVKFQLYREAMAEGGIEKAVQNDDFFNKVVQFGEVSIQSQSRYDQDLIQHAQNTNALGTALDVGGRAAASTMLTIAKYTGMDDQSKALLNGVDRQIAFEGGEHPIAQAVGAVAGTYGDPVANLTAQGVTKAIAPYVSKAATAIWGAVVKDVTEVGTEAATREAAYAAENTGAAAAKDATTASSASAENIVPKTVEPITDPARLLPAPTPPREAPLNVLAPSGNKFVVSPTGQTIVVPAGAAGPNAVINPGGKVTGFSYTGGSGGSGLSPKVTTVRIMNPTPPKGASPGYPNGYVTYQNAADQGVNPFTGKTIPNSDPLRHQPL
jgi:RHS repeat-associated protein